MTLRTIGLGRSMGYPWLQFLGLSRPRLRHFLKLLPLFSKQFQSSLVPYIQFFRYKLLNSNLDPKGTFGFFFLFESGYWLQLFGPKITYITKNMTLGLDVFFKGFRSFCAHRFFCLKHYYSYQLINYLSFYYWISSHSLVVHFLNH